MNEVLRSTSHFHVWHECNTIKGHYGKKTISRHPLHGKRKAPGRDGVPIELQRGS